MIKTIKAVRDKVIGLFTNKYTLYPCDKKLMSSKRCKKGLESYMKLYDKDVSFIVAFTGVSRTTINNILNNRYSTISSQTEDKLKALVDDYFFRGF